MFPGQNQCDGTLEAVEMLTSLLETIKIGFGKRWQFQFSVKGLKVKVSQKQCANDFEFVEMSSFNRDLLEGLSH